jgi:hypothetical protein
MKQPVPPRFSGVEKTDMRHGDAFPGPWSYERWRDITAEKWGYVLLSGDFGWSIVIVSM